MTAGIDFANILFSGPCNLRCPDCIGRRLPRMPDNLDRHPLFGLGSFCAALRRHGVRQLTLTGTDTDPLLHRHLDRLLTRLRRQVPGVRINLHTNGWLALARVDTVNRCDRVCISLSSFRAETCGRMTGRRQALPLRRIVEGLRPPIKISTLVTEHNRDELPGIIERCRALGIRRVVLRRLVGRPVEWLLPGLPPPTRSFGGNPVYELDGLELTVWGFSRVTLRCLNLFSDGRISGRYLLEDGHHGWASAVA